MIAQAKVVVPPTKIYFPEADVASLQRLLNVIKDQNANATKGRSAAINAELKSLETTIENTQPNDC